MGREHVVFGVIMGTGVGGGLVINGRARYGIQGIGGEWGHNFLDESGGLCYCGNTGCVETVISGTALERYYEAISGRKQALATIIKRYEQGQADEQEQATVPPADPLLRQKPGIGDLTCWTRTPWCWEVAYRM